MPVVSLGTAAAGVLDETDTRRPREAIRASPLPLSRTARGEEFLEGDPPVRPLRREMKPGPEVAHRPTRQRDRQDESAAFAGSQVRAAQVGGRADLRAAQIRYPLLRGTLRERDEPVRHLGHIDRLEGHPRRALPVARSCGR